jgi:uncharacterized membrane protein
MTKKSIARLPLSLVEGITPEQVKKKLQSTEGKLAEYITDLSGSMMFVYLHVIAFALFFIFKPFQIEFFNIILSLEAVFLATFILVAQKRQALVDEYRELEEEKEQEEEEREQEELEEEVEDIQKDLDDIKSAMRFIQDKISSIERIPNTNDHTKK